MAKLMMLAGAMVEAGPGRPGAVAAYVVLSQGREGTRIFKVQGPMASATVTELPPATTVDLGRFQAELRDDLEAASREAQAAGSRASIVPPSATWVCDIVREHLERSEGPVTG